MAENDTGYGKLGKNIRNMITSWGEVDSDLNLVNEKLFKALINEGKNPFDTDLPDNFNVSDIIDVNIFTKPKPQAPIGDARAYVCVYMIDSRKSGTNNQEQHDIYLAVDIVSHISQWDVIDTDGGRTERPYILIDILIQLILESEMTSMRGNPVINKPPRIYTPDDKFHGYRMLFEITNSIGGCSYD